MNYVNVQKLLDGARNHQVKVVGMLDTSDIPLSGAVVVFDPKQNLIESNGATPCDSACVDEVEFTIDDGLTVVLWWDGSPPVPVMPLDGRGKMAWSYLYNNAGPGTSGRLLMSTAGWSPAQTMMFTLVVCLHKTVLAAGQPS